MAEKAGLGQNVKNHNGRKTMIHALTNNSIPATDIIQLSGHKNLQSVTNYSVVPEKQQITMSHTLCELSTESRAHDAFLKFLNVQRPKFIQQVRPQIINTVSQQCRSLPVLLFMAVNSTSLLTAALINHRPWPLQKLR